MYSTYVTFTGTPLYFNKLPQSFTAYIFAVFIFAAYALFTTPKKFNINALTTNNILLIL